MHETHLGFASIYSSLYSQLSSPLSPSRPFPMRLFGATLVRKI
ncbi:MAG: hypothetical protein SNJ55_06195 [Chloroherpetonaceae bacterium]